MSQLLIHKFAKKLHFNFQNIIIAIKHRWFAYVYRTFLSPTNDFFLIGGGGVVLYIPLRAQCRKLRQNWHPKEHDIVAPDLSVLAIAVNILPIFITGNKSCQVQSFITEKDLQT